MVPPRSPLEIDDLNCRVDVADGNRHLGYGANGSAGFQGVLDRRGIRRPVEVMRDNHNAAMALRAARQIGCAAAIRSQLDIQVRESSGGHFSQKGVPSRVRRPRPSALGARPQGRNRSGPDSGRESANGPHTRIREMIQPNLGQVRSS